MCKIGSIAACGFETMAVQLDSYRTIFECSPDAMLVVDESGCIVVSNAAAQGLFGRGNLEGLPLESFVPQCRFTQGTDFKSCFLHAGGDQIPVDLTISPLDIDGRTHAIIFVRDETEPANLKNQLNQTRNRYETLLAAIPEIITEVDVEKRYRWANSAGLAFFGDDMIGREASFYFVGQQHTYETVSPLFEGESEAVYVESWQRRHDGEPRLIAWQCRSLADPDGRLIGAISSGRDITDARKNEHELQQQRMLLDHMGRLARIGGWEFDVATMQGRWTEEVARIHDVDISELSVSKGISFYEGKHRELIETSIRNAIENGVPYDIELELISAKGVRKWVRTRGVPVERDGKVVRLEGLIQDITDLKRAREARKESEKAFESIFNASLAGIGIRNLDDGKFVAVNDALLDVYGYEREEIIGHSPEELGLWLDREQRREVLDTLGRQGKVTPFKMHGVKKNGQICTLISSALKIVLGGKNSVIITLMDITEQERMEEILENRNREINTLFNRQIATHTASAIAHELNQPLLAISAYCEAASRMIKAGNIADKRLPDALESAVLQTKRAAQSLREMLNQLNKPTENTEPLDLNHEIGDALDIVSANLGRTLRVNLQLEKGLPAVRATRLHVQKVLLNLINNGIEAMAEAGMAPEEMRMTLSTASVGHFAQVTLTDNGPGLREPAKIFTTFYSTKPKGIGMGLSISRSLIEDHGGKLWFSPAEDRGAVFHFTLPFDK